MSLPARAAREPIFNLPHSVLILILSLVGLHAARTLLLSEEAGFEVLLDWAVVPAQWSVALGSATPAEVIEAGRRTMAEDGGLRLALARFVLDTHEFRPWTAITYALLHGSWAHDLVNCLWLAAFGTPVARRCGWFRFFVLAAAAAIGGAAAHVALHPLQPFPLVGASAAVSGMMAAAVWFMFAPRSEIAGGRWVEPHERPRESLAALPRNRNVLIFLAVWFAVNYLSAELAGPLGMTDASIAWEAHVGGFVVGLLLFPVLDPQSARP
jgi:membrane associated rhomboid family serine protease